MQCFSVCFFSPFSFPFSSTEHEQNFNFIMKSDTNTYIHTLVEYFVFTGIRCLDHVSYQVPSAWRIALLFVLFYFQSTALAKEPGADHSLWSRHTNLEEEKKKLFTL